MSKVWRFFLGIGAAIAALIFLLFPRSKKPKKGTGSHSPPKNTAAEAARDNVQETFEEEVDRVDEAISGPAPASSLADLGNARRRRK